MKKERVAYSRTVLRAGPLGTGSGRASTILPGFLPRGAFFVDTSESEEDDEEAEEADLATATG